MQQLWLSVLIPTYNGANYLASALDSIIAQKETAFEGIEYIIVDDGSTDETLKIINSYQDKLPLKIIQRQRQGNWVANTNYALSVASADRVCFLHQDDLWLPERLTVIKSLIQKYPEVNLFLNPSMFIDDRGKHLGLWQCPLPSLPTIINDNVTIERLLVQNFIAIPAPVFKRELALKIGGLDEQLWYTADWDFWLKIAASGNIIYYSKPLSAFRIHGNSQTILRSSSLTDFRQQLELVVRKYWSSWQAPRSIKNSILKIALFSIEINTALAAKIHGKKIKFLPLIKQFLLLGMTGWFKYFYYSRIWERVSARLKTRLRGSNILRS
ncbi:MAG: glycosyltransferase [Xenococcaceae cyanobacterium]